MQVRLRRRFGFSSGAADRLRGRRPRRVPVPTRGRTRGRARGRHILEAEIERPRTGPMRDIVATIQPEQDVIVRADLDRSPSASRGRRAPARPRSACTGPPILLYAFRDQLSALRCPGGRPERRVFSPTSAMCCPRSVRSTPARPPSSSMITQANKISISGLDEGAVGAWLKGDARMAEVDPSGRLGPDRCAREHHPGGAARQPTSGGCRPTWPTEIVDELREPGHPLRRRPGRCSPQRLAHQVLLRMEAAGDSPDDRVQNAVARSKRGEGLRRRRSGRRSSSGRS